jgi:hypothetical protein
MASLLHDIRRGASPKAEGDEQVMQIRQRRDGNSRLTKPHLPADNGVEHPAGHHDHDARRGLDMNNLAPGPHLAALPPQPPAMQRMPAVMDDDFRPDMGRMSPRLL